MIRRTTTALFVAGLSTAAVASPPSAAFRFTAKLGGTVPPEVPVRVPLPPEVLAKVQPNFADLRLLDDTGHETPYVIYEQVEARREPTSFAFEVVSYEKTDGSETFTLQAPEDAGTYRELELMIDGVDFNKRVAIAASTDDQEWQPLANGAVFDFSSRVDLRDTRVPFDPTQARMLRVALEDVEKAEGDGPEMRLQYQGLEFWTSAAGGGPFRINRFLGWRGERREAAPRLEHVTVKDPMTELDDNGDTVVHLNVRLPVAYLAVDVANPYYYRRVELLAARDDQESEYRVAGSGVIYKVPGKADAENEISLNRPIADLRLKVINEDNPPLKIRSVDVGWVRRNLYFVPESGRRYALYVGNNEVTPPRYELRKLIPSDHATLAGSAKASLSPVMPNPEYEPHLSVSGREALEKTWLVVLIVAVACGLTFWAYRLFRNLPAQKAA